MKSRDLSSPLRRHHPVEARLRGGHSKAVCSHFRLTSADLLSKDRHKSVAFARQVAMYLCRQRLKSSFPESWAVRTSVAITRP